MMRDGEDGLEAMTGTECTEAMEEVMTTTEECTRVVDRMDIRRRCIRGNPNPPATCKPNRA